MLVIVAVLRVVIMVSVMLVVIVIEFLEVKVEVPQIMGWLCGGCALSSSLHVKLMMMAMPEQFRLLLASLMWGFVVGWFCSPLAPRVRGVIW